MTTLAELMVAVGADLDQLESGMQSGVRVVERSVDRMESDADRAGAAIDAAGDRASKAFDAVRPSADRAGDALQGIGDEAEKAADRVEDAGGGAGGGFLSKLRSGLGGISSVAGGAVQAFSGAAVAGIGAAGVAAGGLFMVGLSTAMDNEVASDRLASQLGGSEWAYDMGEIAGDLYTDGFGESAAETGDALKRVVQNGLLPEDAGDAEIEALTGRFLTMTDVMEQDMDMATQAVSGMLRAGLARDGTEALDILTRGLQQGADKAGDLLETFQEYSPAFREVGVDALDATGLMVQGLQAGARDADKVADALKEFGIRAQDGSELSAEGFKLIGLNAEEMTAAVAAGGPAARDALDQVLDGLREMEDPVARNAAAVALFGTQAEDLGDSLYALDLDTAAQGLGTVEGATDKLGSAYDNASSRIESFKRKGLDVLADAVGNHAIPAIETLVDMADDMLGPAIEDLGPVFEDVQSWVGDTVALVEERWPEIEEAISPVIDNIVGTIEAGVDIVETIWTNFGDNALDVVLEAWPRIWQAIQGAFDVIEGIFLFFSALLQGDWAGVWDALGQILSGAWNLIIGLVSASLTWLQGVFGAGWEIVKSMANGAWEWIHRNATNWWGNIIGFITGLPGRIASAAAGMWDSLLTGAAEVIRKAIGWINRLIEAYNAIPGLGNVSLIGLPGKAVSTPTSRNSDNRNQRSGLRQMADGGIARATPGGVDATLAEAGYDEAVIPLPRGLRSLAAVGGRGGDINITVEGSVLSERELMALIRDELDRGGLGGPGPSWN